jgi:pyruvate formate lyase activating enzyme
MVFNIQRYSLHDGPGIRTLVFLKGCPLHCPWCSNPESQRFGPEMAYNQSKCIGPQECGLCLRECPSGATRESPADVLCCDRSRCRECFGCARVCPAQARNVFGKRLSVNEVIDAVEGDGLFYGRSGGGMTISGGEPLAQPEFTSALLREARRRRINTSLETCGYAGWDDLREACGHLDSILYDIKSLDPGKHQAHTGVSNERILDNFLKMAQAFPGLAKHVRTPLIPGFNDTPAEILAIVDFISKIPAISYELLAYHRLGQPKYGYLGREYGLAERGQPVDMFKTLALLAQNRLEKGAAERPPMP